MLLTLIASDATNYSINGIRWISLPRLLGHLHYKRSKLVIQGYCIHFFNAGRKLCDLV